MWSLLLTASGDALTASRGPGEAWLVPDLSSVVPHGSMSFFDSRQLATLQDAPVSSLRPGKVF